MEQESPQMSLLVAWLPYESLSSLKVAVSPEPSETCLRVRGPNCLSQGFPNSQAMNWLKRGQRCKKGAQGGRRRHNLGTWLEVSTQDDVWAHVRVQKGEGLPGGEGGLVIFSSCVFSG